jgi:glycosyltransferase involved in cell wall biosynthesis
VPWFPINWAVFGRYAKFARAPSQEMRAGSRILHPRYPVVPKIGMNIAPSLLYGATKRALARLLASGRHYDIIDAHYFYPDGVAAVILGREFGLPVVITAHGTDLNVIPRHIAARRMILWAAQRAAGLVTVSQDLKNKLVALGTAPDRVQVLGNGVDLKHFVPMDQEAEKRRLGLRGPTLLSVGALIPRKGHHLTIEALAKLPDATLLIAGEGPERARLTKLSEKLQVSNRVRFLGQVPHLDLPALYSAADAMVLPSSFEGWACVFLESMACGTPVIATTVGGNAEVICEPDAGVLIAERSASAVADAIRQLLATPPPREATRTVAERFSWDVTAAGQLRLFRDILAGR